MKLTDIKDNIVLVVLELAFIILWKLKYWIVLGLIGDKRKMSEKSNKKYRYVWRNLERNALKHYEYLTLFQKLKWGFNKKKYVEWYCENNKQYYFWDLNRR